jgi:hypothetical protein
VSLLVVFPIFLAFNTVVWAIAISLDRAWFGSWDILDHPEFWPTTAVVLFMVTGVAFLQFPWGYPASLVLWWLAARTLLELPYPRWLVLFLTLSALSLLAWLALFGALELYRLSR